MKSPSELIYAYALIAETPGLAASGLLGLAEGSPVFFFSALPGLVVVASRVPAALFVASDLPPASADAAWLASAALRHHEVILALHDRQTVVPLRFGTLFSSLPELAVALGRDAAHWKSLLDRIDGKHEVEITLTANADEFIAAELARQQSAWAGLPPGRRYLAERAATRSAEALLASAQEQAWEDFEEKLGILGEDRRIRSESSRVYLLGRSCKNLLELVEKYGEPKNGLYFEIQGTWPAYSFVGRELEALSEGKQAPFLQLA